MQKRYSPFLFLFLAIVFAIIGGCSKPEPKMEVTITSGKKVIGYQVQKTVSSEKNESRQDVFSFAFDPSYTIEPIKTSETIVLDFGDNPPDRITGKDSLVGPDGHYLYDERTTTSIPFQEDGNRYTFEVQTHKWSGLSSLFKKDDDRGIEVEATWKKTAYTYFFVIRTDSDN
ncbi:hypothetical protein [Gorillibacterium timonense]|uniref:hypothetical protein n=1 Tax=Gorillibacterium timonense TaxID=1689269 RepID=UPI00071CA769|nr:hypothetical protein [Gorillibacterium timonense]